MRLWTEDSHRGELPTKTVVGLEGNTLADGFFHLSTWFFVLAGSIAMLASWRQGRLAPNLPFHAGLLLTGWGLFNVVEGVIDHYIVQIHHVRDDLGAPLSRDLGFLAFGLALVVGGWLTRTSGRRLAVDCGTRNGTRIDIQAAAEAEYGLTSQLSGCKAESSGQLA